jgi:hypothetical protein
VLEKFEKVKILDCHICDSKTDKTHLQGLKNLKKKHFQCFKSEFRQKSHFEKKTSPNLPLNTEIFDNFEILKLV